MSPLEDRVWREIEGQLCDVPLTLLDFATRQGIVDRLAPRIAAALESAVQFSTSHEFRAEGIDAGLQALGGDEAVSRSFEYEAFSALWSAMSDAERAPIQAKARWERITLSHVILSYPAMVPQRLTTEYQQLLKTVRGGTLSSAE